MNIERYQSLLEKAMGSFSQKEFAERAGISQFNLNRMLNIDEDADESQIPVPRKSTLRKIAEASQGRVSENQLYAACGYEIVKPVIDANLVPQEYNLRVMASLKVGLETLSHMPRRYDSLLSFLDAVRLAHGTDHMLYRCFEQVDYTGVGHNNAERVANCHFLWRDRGYQSIFSFALFYCDTAKGGCIICDTVFDLGSLLDLNHRDAGKFMFELAEKDDLNYADVPYVFTCRPYNAGEAEKRLLKAIFGEDSND